jgi:hypothetical protein
MGKCMYWSTYTWNRHWLEVSGQLQSPAALFHWIGGWVGPRNGQDDIEKRKFLTLTRLELRPISRPTSSQSLYRLHYPGSRYYCSSGTFSIIYFAKAFKALFLADDTHWPSLRLSPYQRHYFSYSTSKSCNIPNIWRKIHTVISLRLFDVCIKLCRALPDVIVDV